ncbi:MAG: NAD(P)-dependent oxidoreductase [Desulfobacteraceae bacterium]|nr:MAG: NAD(P)-dependent oxidoreductase [Desulfobacteraceae bacterium]
MDIFMNTRPRVLVVGAAGFIGTYLVDALIRDDFDVTAVDINDIAKEHFAEQGVAFEMINITDPMEISRLPVDGFDAVVNLACVQPANISKEKYNPVDYISVNVIGVLNLLEYCRTAKIPKMIIATSHRNTKGLWRPGKKICENEGRAIEFTGEYAMFSISESAAEDCLKHYTREYGLQGIAFRLPPVYGYGPHTIIFKNGEVTTTGFQAFIDCAISGRPIEIWGDPEVGRDIIYVKDVVKAFLLALRNPEAKGLYNISSGRPLSLRQQAEETLKVFGPRGSAQQIVFRPELSNSIDPFLYDNEKARIELGWLPIYSFADLLIDYMKEMESGRFIHLIEKRRQLVGKPQ